jgi:hypothetical protein
VKNIQGVVGSNGNVYKNVKALWDTETNDLHPISTVFDWKEANDTAEPPQYFGNSDAQAILLGLFNVRSIALLKFIRAW